MRTLLDHLGRERMVWNITTWSFRWLERLAVGHRMDGNSIRIGLRAFEVLVYERT